MRAVNLTLLSALLLTTATSALADPPPDPKKSAPPEKECISCGTSQVGGHTVPILQSTEFTELVKQYAGEKLAPGSKALETLLFHGKRTSEMLKTLDESVLPKKHLEFLRRELARNHIKITCRVVDEAGRVRMELDPTLIPLRVRKHVPVDRTVDIQHAEVSGTAVRVGLDRLWVRY